MSFNRKVENNKKGRGKYSEDEYGTRHVEPYKRTTKRPIRWEDKLNETY
jgi:stalled ribosome alternative rescue factor ArfA